ncbi:hypothetical protein H696_06073 [Fonticula alba]|uniref:Uncharacterized protein n=1 Tax=Fonticula alba TaxID=691883 RepID=A0A058YZY2_FONAL|nr:hypothetical protein H696_06073 [Fonticula alba]KCV67554.1 hypothetical protein H696_06073 [Fonticula alba]|eukprot:XP_009498115.1 hypothetical protein H696_06073 [Fonticula alba]
MAVGSALGLVAGLLAWMLTMPVELARGQMPPPSGLPNIYLHRSMGSLMRGTGRVDVVTAPGQASVTFKLNGPTTMEIYDQRDALDILPDYRVGSFFGPVPRETLECPRSGVDPASTSIMALPVTGSPTPALVQHTDQWVALFESPMEHPLPGPATQLLRGLAAAVDDVDLVGVTDIPGQSRQGELFLGRLTSAGLAVRPVGMTVALPVLTATGTRRHFYVAESDALHSIALQEDGTAVVDTMLLSDTVISMVTTRLVSTVAQCPDHADVVLATADGRLRVFPCHGGSQPGPELEGEVPEWQLWVQDSLVAVGPASLDQLSGFFLYQSPGQDGFDRPYVWRVSVSPDGGDLLWQWMVISGGTEVRRNALGKFRTSETGLSDWLMVSYNQVYFDSATFQCSTDESIICDGPSYTDTFGAFDCIEGHGVSYFARPDQICGGCGPRWYLDRPPGEPPFSQPEHECKRCDEDSCWTCNRQGCLVCDSTRIPEYSGPGGRVVCRQGGCSPGFHLVAGVCQAEGPALPVMRISPPEVETLPGLDPGIPVTALAATRLTVDPVSGGPVVPAVGGTGTDPGMVLLLQAGPQARAWLMPNGAIGQPGKAPLQPVALLSGPLPADVVAVAEVGPFLEDGGQLLLGLALCDRQGTVYEAWLECTSGQADGSAPCAAAGGPAVLTPLLQGTGCVDLQVQATTGRHVVMLSDQAQGAALLEADPAGRRLLATRVPMDGMVVLPGPGGPDGRVADPAVGDWLVGTSAGDLPSAMPTRLPVWDSRWSYLVGRFIRGVATWPDVLVPVVLPAGGGFPLELVFVSTKEDQWRVVRAPGEMQPTGATMWLASSMQVLMETLPLPVPQLPVSTLNVRAQGLHIPGSATYPSALLLQAHTMLGVSLLRCPGDRVLCSFLPAVVLELPAAFQVPSDKRLWQVAIPRAGGPAPGPGAEGTVPVVSLLGFSEATGPVHVRLGADCPAGTFGPACEPCHPDCQQACTGPGPGDCVCAFWLPEDPAVCLAACPAGTYSDWGACRGCHASCAECTGPEAGACTACAPGLVLEDGHCVVACGAGEYACASACLPCPGECASCEAASGSGPGCEAVCTGCKPGFVLVGDECVAEVCPVGEFLPPGSDTCAQCHCTCRACAGGAEPDKCTSCPKGFHLSEEGRCRVSCLPGGLCPGRVAEVLLVHLLCWARKFGGGH